MHETGPFSIPAIRNFVPERIKPWIIIVFVIVFQFSGGVYLASVSEMVGSTALRQEDILMAGYASLVGMALTFAVMFRLKFRFPTKTAFFVCSSAIIAANLICMYTHSVPLMVAVCFASGFFRMWATFECNSTIQLWLTPKRDLSVFFCFIYLLVHGCMQLSGLTTAALDTFADWQYVHWFVIGALGCVMLLTLVLFRTFRAMRKLPLYGIDWLGAMLWGVVLLSVIFICVYGSHYDWFGSVYIRMAAMAAAAAAGLNVWRASFIRHPFIANRTWRYRPVVLTLLLYLVADLLLAPAHLFEHIYMEGVLGYDAAHAASLNWAVLAGIVIGAVFTYWTFALHKWAYRTMTVIAFAAIVGYLAWFYLTIDYNLPKQALVIPLFLRGFGYVIMAICFLTVLSRIPFVHFFEAISLQAFVSAAVGGPFGEAVLGRLFDVTVRRNALQLGTSLDRVHPAAPHIPLGELYGAVQQQAVMVSMKELLGWLVLAGIVCVVLFLLNESDIRPQKAIHPTYKAIRRLIKQQMA